MLPFLRRLSGTVASASLSDTRKSDAPPRPSGLSPELKYQVACEYIRLKVDFPLQNRYYELESYEEDVGRRIVIEVFGLSVDASGTGSNPLFSVDTATTYFGLTTGWYQRASVILLRTLISFSSSLVELEIPAVFTISSTTIGGSSPEGSTRPRLSMAQNDSLDCYWHGRLPVVYLWLCRPVWAGLQYLADDFGKWLDSAIHGDDISTRENIKLVSSRFFGPASIAVPLELSLDQLKGLRGRILHMDVASGQSSCLHSVTISRLTHFPTVFISIETASHIVCLNGTGTYLQLDSLKGKEVR